MKAVLCWGQGWKKNGYRGHEDNSALFEGLSLDTARKFLFPAGRWQLGEFSLPEIDGKALNRYLSGKKSFNRSLATGICGGVDSSIAISVELSARA